MQVKGNVMNKFVAIISMVCGVIVFGLAIMVSTAAPRKVIVPVVESVVSKKVIVLDEVVIDGVSTGKAHIKRVVPKSKRVELSSGVVGESMALGSPSGGIFSTERARNYVPMSGRVSSVPNPEVVKQKVRIDSRPKYAR